MRAAARETLAIARWVVDGLVYTPVVQAGRALTPEAVAQLAAAPAAAPTPVRRLLLQLGDEGMARTGPPALDLSRVDRLGGPHLPALEFADLVVGRLERWWIAPAGAVPGTTGRSLGAIARMAATQLGSLVWTAAQAGVVDGVSLRALQLPAGGTVLFAVRLGDRGESCLAAAHVVRCWEEPAGCP